MLMKCIQKLNKVITPPPFMISNANNNLSFEDYVSERE